MLYLEVPSFSCFDLTKFDYKRGRVLKSASALYPPAVFPFGAA